MYIGKTGSLLRRLTLIKLIKYTENFLMSSLSMVLAHMLTSTLIYLPIWQ